MDPLRARLEALALAAGQTFDAYLSALETGATAATADDLDATMDPDPPGERYDERGVIGRGGMGEVRLLFDAALDRSLVRKELRADRGAGVGAIQRFMREARITARLEHPGVVPIHDVGELPDGRPFYTMRQVRGRTLTEVLRARSRGEERWPLRRMIDVVLRVCEVVAYAHSRGVLHRDIKPDNIMVGEFGEVMLLDWGLALDTHEAAVQTDEPTSSGAGSARLTRVGGVLGTPAYISPELARGESRSAGPPSDVYTLGGVLYEVLSGRPPRPGSSADALARARAGQPPPLSAEVDPELARICAKAMAWAPEERYRGAADMVAALGAWLDGERRREQALALVAEADALLAEQAAMRADAEALRAQAQAILEPLSSYDLAAEKRPGWRKQDAADSLLGEAERIAVRAIQTLDGALRVEPALAEAHARLAGWYRAQHVRAEAARDERRADRFEILLRAHAERLPDAGGHADYLRGEGALSLRAAPPGAEVELFRFVSEDRRLVPRRVRALGPAPRGEIQLQRGSYLLEISAPGYTTARYPVLIERGQIWDGAVTLILTGALAEDDCYVPAGWFRSGGDAEAADALPGRRLWLQGFVIKRHPVTNAEYLAFLNALVEQGRSAEAERCAPTNPAGEAGWYQWSFGRSADGGFLLENPGAQVPWLADQPVVLVDWWGARAYAAWLAERDGLPWRLPRSLEWEKAARGVDGRAFPWGDFLEPTWARTVGATAGRPTLVSVRDYPTDASVYGVRGTVGNSRDWCADLYRREGPQIEGDRPEPADDAPARGDERFRIIRGGAAVNGGSMVRPATRFGAHPAQRFNVLGFRLARSLTDP